MIKFLGICCLVELGLLLIAILVIVILSLILKKKRVENIRLYNQKLLDRERLQKEIRDKGKAYEKDIKKAKSVDDLLSLTDRILSNDDNNNR